MQGSSVFSAVYDKFFCSFCLWIKYVRNGWMNLRQIHREELFAPSVRRVWIQMAPISWERLKRFVLNSQGRRAQMNLKVKVKGCHQGQKKCTLHSIHPWQRRNGMRSLQMTSHSSRWHHSIAAGGWFWRLAGSIRLVKHLYGRPM